MSAVIAALRRHGALAATGVGASASGRRKTMYDATQRTGFRVYLLENVPHVVQTIRFLRENHLNLFKQ